LFLNCLYSRDNDKLKQTIKEYRGNEGKLQQTIKEYRDNEAVYKDESKSLKQLLKDAIEEVDALKKQIYELRSIDRKMKWQSTGIIQVRCLLT